MLWIILTKGCLHGRSVVRRSKREPEEASHEAPPADEADGLHRLRVQSPPVQARRMAGPPLLIRRAASIFCSIRVPLDSAHRGWLDRDPGRAARPAARARADSEPARSLCG